MFKINIAHESYFYFCLLKAKKAKVYTLAFFLFLLYGRGANVAGPGVVVSADAVRP